MWNGGGRGSKYEWYSSCMISEVIVIRILEIADRLMDPENVQEKGLPINLFMNISCKLFSLLWINKTALYPDWRQCIHFRKIDQRSRSKDSSQLNFPAHSSDESIQWKCTEWISPPCSELFRVEEPRSKIRKEEILKTCNRLLPYIHIPQYLSWEWQSKMG